MSRLLIEVIIFLFCSCKNCDELGQRFILANVLPKDTLLTYGVRFNFTLSEFKSRGGRLLHKLKIHKRRECPLRKTKTYLPQY